MQVMSAIFERPIMGKIGLGRETKHAVSVGSKSTCATSAKDAIKKTI